MLLGLAFLSRQFWGVIADRIGGLHTIFAGSVCQIVAMVGFLATQSEAGLLTVSAVFGLAFSGIIPAYVLTVRELFPASEASWRVPTLLLFSGSGMAFGGWLAGAIRLRRLLCHRLRHRHSLQSGASGTHRQLGLAPALAHERRPVLRG
jgi:MFS family permease